MLYSFFWVIPHCLNCMCHQHIKFRRQGITQKKEYNIHKHSQSFEIKNNSPVMGRKLQETFIYSKKNSGSIKPHFSIPFLSSSTVKITTPYLVSNSSIISPTSTPPIESVNAPVVPYCRKGYIIIDKNLTTYLENVEYTPVFRKPSLPVRLVIDRPTRA